MSKLSLTTPLQSAVAVAAGGLTSAVALHVADALHTFPPVVPWTVPAMLAVIGVVGFIYGLRIPRRLEERKLSSNEGFIAVITGKSLVLTGAVLAGAHAIYVVKYLDQLSAPTPIHRVAVGTATIITALLMAGAGSLIERNLSLKDPPEDEDRQHAEGLTSRRPAM